MARTVGEEGKIQANGLVEIRQAWKSEAVDLGVDREVREAADGALRDGNLLIAWVLWVLSRDPEERRRIAIWGLRALEQLKRHDQPIDLRKLSRDEFRALGGLPEEPLGGNHRDDSVIRPKGARVRGAPAEQGRKRTG